MTLNPVDHPICFSTPKRLAPSTWIQHVPFAMFLVDLLRPKTIVELGTYYGTSYCAFCQAVDELKITARCYAIDTWRGDPQSGFFGDEVLADLRAHHDPLYADISTLMQTEFDTAIDNFHDHSIDLLHIDGYHTYETVRHDFELWMPKMSSSGVILLHDIEDHREDSGVWKVWDVIKASAYPTFDMVHGHGLGLVAVGKQYPAALQPLFDLSDEQQRDVRRFFFHLGQSVEALQRAQLIEQQLHQQEQQVARLQDELQQTTTRLQSEYQSMLYQQEQQLAVVTTYKMALEQKLSATDQQVSTVYERMNSALQDLNARQEEVERLTRMLEERSGLSFALKRLVKKIWRIVAPASLRDRLWRLRGKT